MTDVPLLSMADSTFSQELLEAWSTVGFVSILDHGIDPTLFGQMRDLCRRVFALPDEEKQSGMITPDNYRGFIPLGFFTPNRGEVNGARPDLYEGFKLHWECPDGRVDCELYGPNRWPDALPDMARTVLAYWGACERLADRLMGEVAPFLGVPPQRLRRWHADPLTNMTLLHYPERPADDTVGIHPHKDTNVITFLHPDPVGGLQVRSADGSWIEPDPPEDALIVNTGEMLELWSGGRLPATPHRVLNPSGRARYSFPWFLVPSHDVVVEPLLPPVEGFARPAMPVGELSAEVWRTNWPDQKPSGLGHDLGALDR